MTIGHALPQGSDRGAQAPIMAVRSVHVLRANAEPRESWSHSGPAKVETPHGVRGFKSLRLRSETPEITLILGVFHWNPDPVHEKPHTAAQRATVDTSRTTPQH